MSLITFIKNNLKLISKRANEKNNRKKKFRIIYKEPEESLIFDYKGSGTFGDVFKVTNLTENTEEIPKGKSVVIKIMKRKNSEPDRLLELSEIINNLKSKMIINKYIMNIYDIDFDKNVIFLEYVDGLPLDDYTRKNKLTNNELNIFFIKSLLSVKVMHNVLKYSHRDIKGPNIIYNPENGIMKCIDYGFICNLKNFKCVNRYEGTGKYIHPDMNRKYKTYKKNSSVIFPNAISQDLFSLLMTIFKLYYISQNVKSIKSNSQNDFFSIFRKYERNIRKEKSKKNNNGRNKKSDIRFNSKNDFLMELMELDINNINNEIIKEIIKIFKKYWNFEKKDFYIKSINNILVTNFIFDLLIFNSFRSISDSEEKNNIFYDWCSIYSYNINF
jgi:serine/threonine protein kinase|uniref:Protein kinase domain protein n=1 Tax=Mimiviridae sp. ChoanoV1 TaxID=2596887 RepID=A0A5B8IE69_9VIRU|nr:protein kinase domain protein [Mimiviridae sp. ChoanoV1]